MATTTYHFPRPNHRTRIVLGILTVGATAVAGGIGLQRLARDDGPATVRAAQQSVAVAPSAADYGLGVALSTDAGARVGQHPDAALGEVLFGTDIPQPTASVSDNGLSLIFSPNWPAPGA